MTQVLRIAQPFTSVTTSSDFLFCVCVHQVLPPGPVASQICARARRGRHPAALSHGATCQSILPSYHGREDHDIVPGRLGVVLVIANDVVCAPLCSSYTSVFHVQWTSSPPGEKARAN